MDRVTLHPEDQTAAELAGTSWDQIDTPALIVDLDRLDANIAEMASIARSAGVSLRPHFKTHKSTAIAARQVAAGARGMTVSKLDEAAVLLDAGIDDILVAYVVVGASKLARLVSLSARGRITVAVDSAAGVEALDAVARSAGLRADVVIEVESGLERCGVLPGDAGPLAELVARCDGLCLRGVFTHAGQAYAATSQEELRTVARDEARAVVDAAESIRARGIVVDEVSVGATPTARLVAGEPGITEIRPGTYAFYDGQQVALGVVSPDRCALTVAATVISRPERDRAIIDGGSKTFGLDRGAHSSEIIPHYGQLLGHEGVLARLSEEHGVLDIPATSLLQVGDRVRILPNHACTVSNLARVFIGIRGGWVDDVLPIEAAGGVR